MRHESTRRASCEPGRYRKRRKTYAMQAGRTLSSVTQGSRALKARIARFRARNGARKCGGSVGESDQRCLRDALEACLTNSRWRRISTSWMRISRWRLLLSSSRPSNAYRAARCIQRGLREALKLCLMCSRSWRISTSLLRISRCPLLLRKSSPSKGDSKANT